MTEMSYWSAISLYTVYLQETEGKKKTTDYTD